MNYAIKDAANVTFYEKSTMQPIMYTDYLNTFSLDLQSKTVFAQTKGVNKIAFDGTKTGTVSMEAEVFELKYLALLLGSSIVQNQNIDVAKREVFTVSNIVNNQITLNATPVANTVAVFNCDTDLRTQLTEIDNITVTGTTVDLGATKPTAEYIVVYYMTSLPSSNSMTVSAQGGGSNLVLIGETSVKDENGNTEFVQIKVCNCKVDQTIKLDLSATAVAKFTATFEILADENNNMVEIALIPDTDDGEVDGQVIPANGEPVNPIAPVGQTTNQPSLQPSQPNSNQIGETQHTASPTGVEPANNSTPR